MDPIIKIPGENIFVEPGESDASNPRPGWHQAGMDFSLVRHEDWDSAGRAYTAGNVLTMEVTPSFTLNRPSYHFRTLALSGQFEVDPGKAGFTAAVDMAVETFGTESNPFGLDPGDRRLAAGAFVVVDFETGMIFDLFASNTGVSAVYERSVHQRTRFGPYPAFTRFIEADVVLTAGSWHHYAVNYDRNRGIVEYSCDGRTICSISNVGAPVGTTSPKVPLGQIRLGGGIFVVLDDLIDERSSPGDNARISGLLTETQQDIFGQGARVSFRKFSFVS